ncbi:hypothetical protein GUJ93_ZPchr0006g43613 [Zizania palustris]|uniref:Uncharacterized protein n=1 Tax=Zizania palustris TaxID=103762 RepID=A0A8J5TC75_ZIZPA|nr:hypothetical protein GUJ93_ZPchr0006g43613 [Zizania palustris]
MLKENRIPACWNKSMSMSVPTNVVGGSVATWFAANRRSINLRGYTPSFSALDDTADGPPISAKKAPPHAAPDDVFDDAELQQWKRPMAYKAHDVEGEMKDSVHRNFNWIKGKCSRTGYRRS